MPNYPLGPLLAARRFREEAAVRRLRQARDAAAAARAAAEAAAREWRRYQEWRPGEEERLFAALRGLMVPLADLDKHREDIQALRAREMALEEEAARARQACEATDREAAAAQESRAAAARDTRKMETHRERWQVEENKRVEAAEEAEMEEFAGAPTLDGDDGAASDSAAMAYSAREESEVGA